MKKFILFLLLAIVTITILEADEPIKLNIDTFCTDSNIKEFTIEISSNQLYLTKDAIQDNLGGYVDIPENRYYLKTTAHVYSINGIVKNDYKNNVNKFYAYINDTSEKYIKIEELYGLKNSKDLQFIQKINLEENSFKNTTTTTILDVYFDENLLNNAYEKCNNVIHKQKDTSYLYPILFIFFILIIYYVLKMIVPNTYNKK